MTTTATPASSAHHRAARVEFAELGMAPSCTEPHNAFVPLTEVDHQRLREVCERYGVASLEVFGSVARGEDGPNSDVDLLYVLKPGVALGFDIFRLEDDLADLFGRPVDLASRGAINRYIREQVVAEAQALYPA